MRIRRILGLPCILDHLTCRGDRRPEVRNAWNSRKCGEYETIHHL